MGKSGRSSPTPVNAYLMIHTPLSLKNPKPFHPKIWPDGMITASLSFGKGRRAHGTVKVLSGL